MEVELQLFNWNVVSKDFSNGTITLQQFRAEQQKINKTCLELIQELETKDQQKGSSPGLNDYHSYTCNRQKQDTRFRSYYQQNKDCKTLFFYLYGGERQAHEGLFRRFAHHLAGELLDRFNPEMKREREVLPISLDLSNHPDLDIFKTDVLQKFFRALSIRVNAQEPLLDKNLQFVCNHSPKLKAMGGSDIVCIQVIISHYDWDKDLVPQVTRWFIHRFCSCELDKDSPSFLFFFSIDYEEEDKELQEEIIEIVRNSEAITALDELESVTKRDIGKWLSSYRIIAPKASDRNAILEQYFGKEHNHYYMEDVQEILLKLIHAYNKDQVR